LGRKGTWKSQPGRRTWGREGGREGGRGRMSSGELCEWIEQNDKRRMQEGREGGREGGKKEGMKSVTMQVQRKR
jgi:hypothetical protein